MKKLKYNLKNKALKVDKLTKNYIIKSKGRNIAALDEVSFSIE